MPFRGEILNTERLATKRIRLMVEAEKDPVMREAIALQAYEEARHASLFESLMQCYEIEVPEPERHEPRDAQWSFLRVGYGEVFDIFFAFGLFKLAAEAQFSPESLTEIFEGLVSEEARHIIFFTNWAASNRRQVPARLKPWYTVERSVRGAGAGPLTYRNADGARRSRGQSRRLCDSGSVAALRRRHHAAQVRGNLRQRE